MRSIKIKVELFDRLRLDNRMFVPQREIKVKVKPISTKWTLNKPNWTLKALTFKESSFTAKSLMETEGKKN